MKRCLLVSPRRRHLLHLIIIITLHLIIITLLVILIRVRHDNFDAFWNANGQVGPSGKAVAALEPEMRERLREHLRATMPAGPDGGIEFDSWANAVKGRVAER